MPQRHIALLRAFLPVALAIAAAVLLAMMQHFTREPARRTSPSTLVNGDWTSAVAAADNDTLQTLIHLAGLPQDSNQFLLDAMLRSDRAEVRAAGCMRIAEQNNMESAGALIQRMSDQDWRVRSAAFEAMQIVAGALPNAPSRAPPLRDTPVEQRETLILEWIEALGRGQAQTAGRLCDIYALPSHWLCGPQLAEACLNCHAPSSEFAASDFAKCADCHRVIHQSWASSAHAQSTTHLNLVQVDPSSKQVVRYEHGDRVGLNCLACHRIEDSPNVLVPAGTENLRVPHRFRRGAASNSCVQCHEKISVEWTDWSEAARPVAARWPPGEIQSTEASPAPSCIDCHMPGEGDRSHSFSTRRDQEMMLSGIHARIEPSTEQRGAELVVTNLAGHAYPTGTVRRAVRIEYWFDGDESARGVLAHWSAFPPNHGPGTGPLRPAEVRRVRLPANDSASRITCRIIFERNQFSAGSFELPLIQVTERTARPPN